MERKTTGKHNFKELLIKGLLGAKTESPRVVPTDMKGRILYFLFGETDIGQPVPPEDILVRASTEPMQAQEAVLLRAVTEGQETPPEELVRAVNGQE